MPTRRKCLGYLKRTDPQGISQSFIASYLDLAAHARAVTWIIVGPSASNHNNRDANKEFTVHYPITSNLPSDPVLSFFSTGSKSICADGCAGITTPRKFGGVTVRPMIHKELDRDACDRRCVPDGCTPIS